MGGARRQDRRRRPPRAGRARVAAAVAAVALLSACSGGASDGPAVPTFPGAGAAPASASAAPARTTLLPTDCNQLLNSEDLPNLLGLPLGSVSVTGLRDVPAPSVGRLERVTCNYTSNRGAATPPQGTPVLKVLSSGYTTPDAARSQADVNAQVEQTSGVTGVPTPIGTAQGTYYDDPEGPLLVVVYGRVTASLTLGSGPVRRDQARLVLVDLAQRVLPVLVPATGP